MVIKGLKKKKKTFQSRSGIKTRLCRCRSQHQVPLGGHQLRLRCPLVWGGRPHREAVLHQRCYKAGTTLPLAQVTAVIPTHKSTNPAFLSSSDRFPLARCHRQLQSLLMGCCRWRGYCCFLPSHRPIASCIWSKNANTLIGWQHQQPVKHPLPRWAGGIPLSSGVWKGEAGMPLVSRALNLLKHGKPLEGCVCISLCPLCPVLWVHALSDHPAPGPLATHAAPVSSEWGSWPCVRVHQWGEPLQSTFVVY